MKRGFKGFVCGVLATTLVVGSAAFAVGQWKTIDVLENDITVIVDGVQLNESNFLYNDRTYLPLRAVAEVVGKPVYYDETTNTAYISDLTTSVGSFEYYEEMPWCPDYGSVTGTDTIRVRDIGGENNEKQYAYIYSILDGQTISLVKYYEALKSEGFQLNPYSTAEFSYFYKDNYSVSIGVDKDTYLVIILVTEYL